MSETSEAPKPVPSLGVNESSGEKRSGIPRFSRRGLAKGALALGTAGLALFGRPKKAEAQHGTLKPLPGQDPDNPGAKPMEPVKTTSLTEAEREAERARKSREYEELAKFKADAEQLAGSVQKALPAKAKNIRVLHFNNTVGNSAWGDLEKQEDGSCKPSIQINTKDLQDTTLDAALLLTGEEVARIINQGQNNTPAALAGEVYNKIFENLSDEERMKAVDFFEISEYVKGPRVEVSQNHSDGFEQMHYHSAFSILRLKSDQIVEKLEDSSLSPKVREGVALIFLAALKGTVDRSSGQILPKDLGFNELAIRRLMKMSGNKTSIRLAQAA